MGKGLLASVAVALGVTGVALGQPVPLPPAAPKPSEISPDPAAGIPVPAAYNPMEHLAPPVTNFDAGAQSSWLATANLEYLLWFFPRGRPDTVVAADTSAAALVGAPLLVASDSRLDHRPYSGGRLTLGLWQAEPNGFYLPADLRTFGFEARLFTLGEQSLSGRVSAPPTILRPFINANDRQVSAVVVAAAGLATGEISAESRMNLWGAELNAWRNVFYNGPCTTFGLGLTAGLRYLEADPEFQIQRYSQFAQNLTAFPAFQSLAGNRIQEIESFATRNRFVGGQIGVDGRVYLNPVIIDAAFKLALGANNQELNIEGSQVRTLANGQTVVSPGALLALPSNIGNYTRTKFSQVPEFDLNVAWPVLPCLTLKFEAMTMFWSKVLRPRDQIDRVIDVSQIPSFPGAAAAVPTGLRQPGVSFRQSDLWTLGLGFGAELKW